GFAGGNNIALECVLSNSDSDYFLLLNNDTSVDPEFLSEMVKVTESNPDVGIAGCKTYFYDEPNRLQVVWQELNLCTGQNVLVGSMEMDRGQYERVKIVEYVQGSCFLIKRGVVEKIGLLDEAFFCYWEEADYCLQAAKAGYKTVYVPKAKIWHKESLSISRSSEVASYYLARNIFLIMRKHATKRQFLSFLFYFFGYQFWYTSLESIIYHRNIGGFAAFFKGTVDGIKLIYR
ncbi:MAG: glycosyltransferase family 2 protein, partial [Planctomycetes bacterium]|nr:glycosyltransferase family 2 protein [Planctomycetota bacterium]